MAQLVSALISDARYDLRDTRSTQYSDAELLAYYNRALKVLDGALVRYDSDYVHSTDQRTLSSGSNSITLPTTTISVDEVWTTDDDECKKTSLLDLLRRRRYCTSTGEPQYWALDGLKVQFDYTADQDYTITSEVVKKTGKQELSDECPYNDAFSEVLRQALVLFAKNRQEYDINGAAIVGKILSDAAFASVIRRGYNKKIYKLGF